MWTALSLQICRLRWGVENLMLLLFADVIDMMLKLQVILDQSFDLVRLQRAQDVCPVSVFCMCVLVVSMSRVLHMPACLLLVHACPFVVLLVLSCGWIDSQCVLGGSGPVFSAILYGSCRSSGRFRCCC